VFVAPVLTQAELERHYAHLWTEEQDPARASDLAIDRALEGRRFQRRLHEIQRFVSAGRLLDVGCKDGSFLTVARQRGWEPQGVELTPAAAQRAQHQRLPVVIGTLAAARFPAASFDVVTVWHLIEHLTQPVAFLQEIHRILKPTGLLAIETPNIDSRAFRRYGVDWEYLVPPQHLCYFGPQSLQFALEHTDYQVVFQRCEGGTGVGLQLAQAGLGGARLWLRKYYRWFHPLKVMYLALLGWAAPIDSILVMYARPKTNL